MFNDSTKGMLFSLSIKYKRSISSIVEHAVMNYVKWKYKDESFIKDGVMKYDFKLETERQKFLNLQRHQLGNSLRRIVTIANTSAILSMGKINMVQVKNMVKEYDVLYKLMSPAIQEEIADDKDLLARLKAEYDVRQIIMMSKYKVVNQDAVTKIVKKQPEKMEVVYEDVKG